jgi:hypothetical protein
MPIVVVPDCVRVHELTGKWLFAAKFAYKTFISWMEDAIDI